MYQNREIPMTALTQAVPGCGDVAEDRLNKDSAMNGRLGKVFEEALQQCGCTLAKIVWLNLAFLKP